MKKIFIVLVVVGLLTGGALLVSREEKAAPVTKRIRAVDIRNIRIPVVVVDTEPLRTQGLSGREILPPDSGMLFIMDTIAKHGIWMKDMHFSIDIIWTDDSGRVVTIVPNAAPESYPNIFYADAPARYVLEVNAGFAAEHGISVGDTMTTE